MTSAELQQLVEKQIAELPDEDRVLWMRYSAAAHMNVWPFPHTRLFWSWGPLSWDVERSTNRVLANWGVRFGADVRFVKTIDIGRTVVAGLRAWSPLR